MWVLVFTFFMFLSTALPPPRNLLSIRHGGTLGGQVVSASDEFEDNEGCILG